MIDSTTHSAQNGNGKKSTRRDYSSPVTKKGYRAGEASANAGRRFPVEILNPDEVRALIGACSNRAPTGIRNRALLVMMYRGGLRVSEALALRPKDIDADQGTVAILHGKGDRQRTIGLDPGAFAVIARWVERRESLGLNGHHPLFCTLDGRPMHSSYVRQLMPRLAKKTGIEKRCHPHGLRHAYAFEIAVSDNRPLPLPIIKAALGHASLSTTDRYLNHIAPAELIESLSSREWTL
jgi:site-specific recombinase XerD